MKFLEQYQQLKDIFDLNKDEISIPGSTLKIRNLEFTSHIHLPSSLAGQSTDSHISENMKFRYPVMLPGDQKQSGKAIILLHGLNERTWHKHLTGARFLVEKTGVPVIMFPLSFHINRGLPEWNDLRKMSGPLADRRQRYPGIKEASPVNVALSERLTEIPERFFISGLQSALELVSLIDDIRDGKHPFFEKNTKTDLFAYSISCMLLQSLMISNPGTLRNSRIVLFAGGSLFGYMQGISKFIMDSVAFETIRPYYMQMIARKNTFLNELRPWIMEHKFGDAFRSLIIPGESLNKRKEALKNFGKRLMVIALRDDRIMPLEGIRQAVGEQFSKSENFKILHFPYQYTHENPFPVLYRGIDNLVESAFQSVFEPTMEFLAK